MRKLIGFTHLLLLAACGSLWAQPYGPYGPTDGFTQTSVAPGTPAGSYALMGVDNVNYYNGNLNVTLPLFHVGGRGKAGYDIVLPLERKWRIHQYITKMAS